jgi:hypothetical protein
MQLRPRGCCLHGADDAGIGDHRERDGAVRWISPAALTRDPSPDAYLTHVAIVRLAVCPQIAVVDYNAIVMGKARDAARTATSSTSHPYTTLKRYFNIILNTFNVAATKVFALLRNGGRGRCRAGRGHNGSIQRCFATRRAFPQPRG